MSERVLDKSEMAVSALLERMGYLPEPVPEGPEKRCDFLATREHERLLIEVKTRGEPNALSIQLLEEDIVSYSLPVATDPGLRSKVNYASKQLQATEDAIGADHLLAWLVAEQGIVEDTRLKQLRLDLIGARQFAYPVNAEGEAGLVTCVFARPNRLEQNPMLSGVVVQGMGGVTLFANPFCDRVALFRRTEIYRFFDALGAVFEPEEAGISKGFWRVPAEVDSQDLEGMKVRLLRLLECDTGFWVDFESHAAVARVQDPHTGFTASRPTE